MKHIFISLLNFNGKKNTIVCLESLKNIKRENFKITIVAVDNGSREEFDLKSGKIGEIPLIVIKNDKNLGFSGGNNIGIRHALKNGADYVLILNNDTYVDKNFLEELLKASGRDEKIGILVPKIYFAPGFEFHKDRYKKEDLGKVFWYAGGEMDWENIIGRHRGVDEVDHGQYDRIEETDFASGCCMFVKKDVFGKIGVFDDKYFLYYEDSDLSERAKRAGYKIIYAPSAIIWHKNAGSAGGSGSELQDYYITRNRLLFGMRYGHIRSKFALVRESLLLMFRGRYWQKRGVTDFFRNKLGRGSFEI